MSESTAAFWVLILAILAVTAALGSINAKRRQKEQRQKFLRAFGKKPDKKIGPLRMEHIGGYLKAHPSVHAIDGITWNDLDMDAVFSRIDSTKSSAGEEYLWYLLHSPAASGKDTKISEEAISFFCDDKNAGTRVLLEEDLAGLGRMGRYSFSESTELFAKGEKIQTGKHVAAFLLPFLAIGIMFLDSRAGILLFLAVIVLNIASYSREKQKMEGALLGMRYLLRMLKTAEKIGEAKIRVPGEDLDLLRKDREALRSFSRGAFWVTGKDSGNPFDVVLDYIRMIFHVDLIQFSRMTREANAHREEIGRIETELGRIDAEIAIASFRKSLPFFCTPEFDESRQAQAHPFLDAAGLYHPLLDKPVPNDILADRPVLLTGSNASGKSTFLKSTALGALLAQTIHTVCASHYRAPYFAIMSSMALRDSILGGQSYFMVEIRSLKRILDAAEDGGLPVLAFIDEVLRGTNTVERIAASTAILTDLAGRGALLFAATHDGELTESLSGTFDNYHFAETWDGKDVRFSYLLHKGPADTRNAIRLLQTVGFDESVTERAQKLASDFEKTGIWDWRTENQ